MPDSRRWKGKERAVEADEVGWREQKRAELQEGSGEAGGVVLPLDMVGNGIYDVAYTIPVKFGDTQQFSLQIDTGSSDLWVASTSCTTQSCGEAAGRLYNPSAATSTGEDFTIPYLQGSAAGPIYWDHVSLGGYIIDSQALAAANDVQSEPLGPKFSGILGLALPLNSIIATKIPPVTGNSPDGAAFASNLFSLTPATLAPAARFISLSLSRPGSDRVPALLGIGRHPAALVPDPSQVQYATLVSESSGTLFWKASVRAITVYVGGVPRVIDVGRSNTGAVFPSAVIDSGVPLILTTSKIANAIYGAIGVTPASDGNYYVPCTTPLNMTITVDNRPETPLHPLDLTAEPPEDNNSQFCIGLIQPADAQLSQPDSSIGDMILGVPFLRNVYTVMAYTVPDTNGSFTSPDASQTDGGVSKAIRPRLGLMSLTDPTIALREFNTVRVLNQPISSSPSSSSSNTGSDSNTKTVTVGGKKLSVGVVVLLGLLGFVALCGALFALRWVLYRRRYSRRGHKDDLSSGMTLDQKAAYRLARRMSSTGAGGEGELTEDELRELRYRAYMRKEKRSASTLDSERTRVSLGTGLGKEYDEFGYSKHKQQQEHHDDGDDDAEETWDPRTSIAWGGPTLAQKPYHHHHMISVEMPLVEPPSPPPPLHVGTPHKQTLSVDQPLLINHARTPSDESGNEGQLSDSRYSVLHHEQEDDDLGELGFANGATMAGVGTASRARASSSSGIRPSSITVMGRAMGTPTGASFRESLDVRANFSRDSMASVSSGGTAVDVVPGQRFSLSPPSGGRELRAAGYESHPRPAAARVDSAGSMRS